MDIKLEPGRYIVAVSGGVDSVVLLDMLRQQSDLELIVAHYDHGIRSDSKEDRLHVQKLAAQYGVPCIYAEGGLGERASEAQARAARYRYFHEMRRTHNAQAIITAHHQDDLLETAILNLIRGTGRKGLTALSSSETTIRPLLGFTKRSLVRYAEEQGLVWREDSTNENEKYLRNYIRRRLLSRFDAASRAQLLGIIERMRTVNEEVDSLMLLEPTAALRRTWFASLSHSLAKEFLASWLRNEGLANFDTATLERAVVAAKVQRPGSKVDLVGRTSLAIERDFLALQSSER